MGAADSKHIESLPVIKSDIFIMYCCQNFGAKIYLINAPDDIARVIHDTISCEWSSKCKIESKYQLVKKVDPGSSPFLTMTTEGSIKSRHLFCKLNNDLLRYGWVLLCAPQFVHKNGLSAWIYTKSKYQMGPVVGDYCAISLSSWSELQFIDFPSGLAEELASHIRCVYVEKPHDERSEMGDELLRDAKNSKVGKLEEVLPRQFKLSLSGSPWIATGKNSLRARNLLVDMITFMYTRGFKLQVSTLLKEETSDCLFFAKLASPPPPVTNSHILLALKADDYIVVLGADDHIVSRLRTSFHNHWREGLKDTEEKHGYPVIVLNGNPWPAQGLKEIEVKKMLLHVLEDASQMGYEPIESIDCSRRIEDKSALLLAQSAPCRMRFICLSVSTHSDKFYIINASHEELDVIRNEIRRSYTPGIEKEEEHGDAFRIKFNCNPISGYDTKGTICFQVAILSVLHELEKFGYKLSCSADVSKHMIYRHETKTYEALSAHSLFLCRPLTNTSGGDNFRTEFEYSKPEYSLYPSLDKY